MKKFGRFLRLNLYIVPIVIAALLFIKHFAQQAHDESFQKVSKDVFVEKLLSNYNNDYYKSFDWLRVITVDGERYEYVRQHSDDSQKISRAFMNKYGSIGSKSHTFNPLWFDIPAMLLGCYLGTLLLIVPWFLSLFDLLQSEFRIAQNKWIWLLSMFLFPIVSAYFYLVLAEEQKA